MSDLKDPTSALLFTSVLFNHTKISDVEINELLKKEFGSFLIFNHDFFPMKEYYAKEMGDQEQLSRYFLFFTNKISRTKLIDAKLFCDNLERKYMQTGLRQINVDPGFVSADQVVLATGKPYSHRIYLDKGVFAELTYRFKDGSYFPLEWTYPDYCHQEIIEKFCWFREFLFY